MIFTYYFISVTTKEQFSQYLAVLFFCGEYLVVLSSSMDYDLE